METYSKEQIEKEVFEIIGRKPTKAEYHLYSLYRDNPVYRLSVENGELVAVLK